MAVKSISELDSQVTANESDLFEVAVVDGGSASGYSSKKESAAAIAEGIVNQYTYPLGMPNMQAKTILGAINQLLANVAAVYDDTATYAVGAFVTHNGQLYKCNTAIDTAETFDPTKWDAVNLADNLGSGGGGIDYSTEEQIVGTWIDGKPLYQKTIVTTLISSNTGNYVTFNHGISNIDAITDADGFLANPNTGALYKRLSFSNIASENSAMNGQYSTMLIIADRTTFVYLIGAALYASGYTKAVTTIRYTKTTD